MFSFRKLLFAVFFCMLGNVLSAQISIQIRTSYQNFMLYDPIYVKMSMRNYSAHPVTFGDTKELKGSLRFDLRTYRDVPVKTFNTRSLLRGVILGPGETKVFTFNLQNYFHLYDTGQYRVKVIVTHPKLKGTYVSRPVLFSIRTGTCIWQREFGLPDAKADLSGKVPTRTYKFHRFNDGITSVYYMSIEDKEKVYTMRRIGFDLGENLHPQYAIDPQARYHLLIAVTPKIFAHYIYTSSGVLEKRDVLIKRTTTPFLVTDAATGNVRVDGGDPAVKDVDYEEIKNLPFMDDVETVREKSVFDEDDEAEKDAGEKEKK